MPKPALIVMFLEGAPAEVHRFPMPVPGEDGFYWAVTSFDAYRCREASRLYEAQYHSRVILAKRGCADYEGTLGSALDLAKNLVKDGAPEHHHESLWAAYEAIGYDYKRKRYAEPEASAKKPRP